MLACGRFRQDALSKLFLVQSSMALPLLVEELKCPKLPLNLQSSLKPWTPATSRNFDPCHPHRTCRTTAFLLLCAAPSPPLERLYAWQTTELAWSDSEMVRDPPLERAVLVFCKKAKWGVASRHLSSPTATQGPRWGTRMERQAERGLGSDVI